MQRLSGLDASFLYLETPTMHMHVALVAILDPSTMPDGYDYDRIHRYIDQGVRTLPQLQRRLMPVPLQIDHPVWLEDPNFDTLHHVRRISCPAPGGPEQLAALVGRILSTPLDRARPLWEAWVVEGLEGGRFALIAKVHHAITDGVAGTQIMSALFSASPHAPPASPTEQAAEASEAPSDLDLLRDAVASRITRPVELVRMFRKTSNKLYEFYERRRNADHNAGATLFDAPRTRWNGPLSAQRVITFARLPQSEIKLIRKPFGASANEVVLAVCAGALRMYLEAHGELPLAPLVAACPIATTRARTSSANKVSAMVTSLATHLEDPVERLLTIRAVTRGAKQEHDALGGDMIRSWAELATPGLVTTAARLYSRYRMAELHRPMFNLLISNVPGPRVPIYFAGAKLVAAYPLGPISEGAGLNITVMTYADNVDFGIVSSPSLVSDIERLTSYLPVASRELVQAAQRASEVAATKPSAS
ncbi:MAG: wax ester/triacylglycerol synthase family O-acyltransferase [Polyangiales bacterium]